MKGSTKSRIFRILAYASVVAAFIMFGFMAITIKQTEARLGDREAAIERCFEEVPQAHNFVLECACMSGASVYQCKAKAYFLYC